MNDYRRGAVSLPIAVGILLFTVSAPPAVSAQAGDAFVCYVGKPSRGEAAFPVTTVEVRDEWQDRSLDIRRPNRLCVPADVGGGIDDPNTYLRAYKSRTTRHSAAPASASGIHTSNLVGDLIIERKAAPQLLLVPAAVDASADPPPPAPGGHAVDHFRCHRAKSSSVFSGAEITVEDSLSAPRTLRLQRLLRQCSPVDAQGLPIADPARELLCYKVKPLRGETAHVAAKGLHVADQFFTSRLDTVKERELCLPTRAVGACNRFGALCDRAFDAVAHATTHNAMSNAEDGWLGPNQNLSVANQLEAGVRALMLDTWYFAGQPVLCHGGDVFPCNLTGMRALADGLADIRSFLDRHPNEVVSIIFESYISELDTQSAFFDSGLIQYTHTQASATPWPTLRSLIDTNARLIVFTDDSGASLPWHHYVWSHAWETHFSFSTPTAFSCAKNRGSLANPLFILNHFLTQVIGTPELAEMVNHNPLFLDRALQCQMESGRLPNFVTVDFFDIGDLLDVVNTLNGV